MNHVWNYPLVQSWHIFKLIRSLADIESSNISPNSWSLSRVGEMFYKWELIVESSLKLPFCSKLRHFQINQITSKQKESSNISSKSWNLSRVGDMIYKWKPNGESSLKHVLSAISSFSTRAPLVAWIWTIGASILSFCMIFWSTQRCSSAKTGYGTSNMFWTTYFVSYPPSISFSFRF